MKKTLLVLIFFLVANSAKILAQGLTEVPDTSLTGKGINEYNNKRYAMAYSYLLIDTGSHYAIGQYYIGLIFYNGLGVKEDNEEALKWFTKAAEQDYDKAQNKLGIMYSKAEGVYQDYDRALKWFKKAADNGNTSAQNSIGILYAKGYGVIKNDTTAFNWYQKAAKNNNATAQSNLASYYENGRVVEQNDSLAFFWYQKAANNGNTNAQNLLGLMYGKGRGVIKNDTMAFYWYQKAAQQGNTFAQYNLGNNYKNGRGIKQNDSLAVFWYQKAADNKDADAQNNLGWMYEKGRGVAQSDSIAHVLYSLAEINGSKNAKNNLKNLADKAIRRDPKLYLQPPYNKGLTEKNKKDIRKKIVSCYNITGQLSMSLAYEDLLPLSSRIPESPATIKKLEALKQKLKADPSNFGYAMSLGSGYNELNMKEEALIYLNKADSLGTLNLVKNPNDSVQLFRLAFVQIIKKDFNKGIELSTVYLSKYGLSNDANFIKLFCYMGLGDRNKLIALSDSLITKQPDVADNYLFVELMNILPSTMNKADSAHIKDTDVEKLFDIHRIAQAAKAYPNNFKIQFTYMAIRQFALIMKLTEVKIFSKKDKVELNKIKLFYEAAIKRNDLPSKYIFYKFLGSLAILQLKYHKALDYTQKAIEIKKHEPSTMFSTKGEIYDQLISLYVMKKKAKQAQNMLEEKIKDLAETYQNATDYVSLSKYQLKKNEIDAAEKSLKQALQINPAANDAFFGLSVISTIKGNDVIALEYLDKIPETERESTEFYTAKGITQLLLGEYKYAYNCFDKAKELDKDFDTPVKLLKEYFLPSK